MYVIKQDNQYYLGAESVEGSRLLRSVWSSKVGLALTKKQAEKIIEHMSGAVLEEVQKDHIFKAVYMLD